MKSNVIIALLGLQVLIGCSPVAVAGFDSGSTGAFGTINITADTTLTLPPDGVFNCTTITVAPGVTLRFNPNALNTPVYLLAIGDVIINGAIDVSGLPANGPVPGPGRGGPGGFAGGHGGSVFAGQNTAGDGTGPGRGRRALGGGDPAASGHFGNVYGNLLCVPLIGGSGGAGEDGAPGYSGGGGGGAVLIASNTKIVITGTVIAAGAGPITCTTGGGSGGAIRLVSPLVVGAGSLNTSAGYSFGGGCGQGGGVGRVRIDCSDNQSYRTLTLIGVASRGMQMFVFPAVVPQLDIVTVAGQAIPQGTNSPVLFELPIGASTNQTVTVQARNFTNDVPIRVVVTPENGASASFDVTLLQSSGTPPNVIVPVVIPAGSVSQINVWTR